MNHAAPSNGSLYNALHHLDNNSILAQLFLNENNLFLTTNDKVTTWIDRTLVEQAHFVVGTPSQNAFATPQHDWHAANIMTAFRLEPIGRSALEVDVNRCRVGQISQSALIRGDLRAWKMARLLVFGSIGRANSDIKKPVNGQLQIRGRYAGCKGSIPYKHIGIDIAVHSGVCLYNVLEIGIDKVIV